MSAITPKWSLAQVPSAVHAQVLPASMMAAAVNAVKVLAQAKILGVKAAHIGSVGGTELQIKTGEQNLTWDLRELHDLWWNSIARAMT